MSALLNFLPEKGRRKFNMLNSDEYMKAIVSDTYSRGDINIKEPTLQNINLYPELFLRINPVVINKCKKIDQKLTSDLIERITNQVLVELNQKENKDSIQRDFIQILVLNQLINK